MTFDTQKLRDALSNTSREPWITEQDEDSDYTTVGPGQDGCVQNSMFRIHSEAHADLIVELHNSAWDLLDTIDAQAAEITQLNDVLRRNGFVRCDIPACNCGSWHARYGWPERMHEITDALAEAGHPPCNENGNLPLKALAALVSERDAMREALNAIEQWEVPVIESRGEAVSMSMAYGSNGVRDYFRGVARAALSQGEPNASNSTANS